MMDTILTLDPFGEEQTLQFEKKSEIEEKKTTLTEREREIKREEESLSAEERK